ncbi:hypothetical protein Aph02nite_25380 [Actinoplanes philippinensis]|uniref:Uncharacterized protein n=1 Tax=Actinoplanes philippinensis TaxID=35752 RepID=A0A1I2G4Y3_9ACTN|nr:hypothetical protein [Actinoplanes philippinensis]GIE76588.1 hypothetical protein Aph02nite_25380 [Actinoplanes philippinensis]SFF12173.1 hypothetical protein SAMN05421541_106195 [Actinoplanes philippinensis]
MLSTIPGPQRLDRVRDLLETGADDVLATELIALGAANEDSWRYDDAMVLRHLEALPARRRHTLILAIGDRATAPAAVCELQRVIARNLTPDEMPWPVARHLIDAACAQITGLGPDLDVLAAVAERETGTVPPGLIAVMRRTAHYGHPPALLRPWIAKADGLLNAGEPWAEAADADPGARPMLVHALRVTGSRPLVRWSREARALDLPAGWRQRVHDWFALVPLPRTIGLCRFDYFDADELIDSYNASALRGLLFLLAVTDPVPADAAAVGALAEYAAVKVRGQGSRDTVVANAAILTLELLGTQQSLDELERLRAARLPAGMIARVIKAAARCRAVLSHV